jgi:hypothetical protein
MENSHTSALERIARVLAGMRLSINGEGQGRSVGAEVDDTWQSHMDEAFAILNALKEPDARMAGAGDTETWTRMVRVALGEEVPSRLVEAASWMQEETYQKPLG